jgi:hypothetical protein
MVTATYIFVVDVTIISVTSSCSSSVMCNMLCLLLLFASCYSSSACCTLLGQISTQYVIHLAILGTCYMKTRLLVTCMKYIARTTESAFFAARVHEQRNNSMMLPAVLHVYNSFD